MSTRDDTHVYTNGLTHADIRAAVAAAFARRDKRRRSHENCRYVRELLRERQPHVAAALNKVVRDA